MAFNTKEVEIIKAGMAAGKTSDEVKQAIINYRNGIFPSRVVTPPPEKPNMGFKDTLSQQTFPNGPQSAAQTVANAQLKVADVTGMSNFGKGIGTAISNGLGTQDTNINSFNQGLDIQNNLFNKIKQKKALGEDTSRLQTAYDVLTQDLKGESNNINDLGTSGGLKDRQFLASAGQTFLNLGAGSVLSNAAAGTVGGLLKPATTFLAGVGKGALIGAVGGAAIGAPSGALDVLQKDEPITAGEVGKGAITGGVGGAITGGILGGIVGGISAGMRGHQLRAQVLSNQQEAGQKPILDTKNLTPLQNETMTMAEKQGIPQKDIEFIATMNAEDKTAAKKMLQVADEVSKNKRVLTRPMDIAGEDLTSKLDYINQQNTKFGKEVNTAGKALKGQLVDATPIKDTLNKILDDVGATMDEKGKIDWTNSVFKNTPSVQNIVEKTVSQIPEGETDAYGVHIFKKTIDNSVDYAKKAEGLTGQGENILKNLRSSADSVLDNFSPEYRAANDKFRVTKTVLNDAEMLFGKSGIDSSQKSGSLLRTVFSNSNNRSSVLKLLSDADTVANQFNGKFKTNSVDQALFSSIIEDVYGNPAPNGIQGETTKAIKVADKVINGNARSLTAEGIKWLVDKTEGVSDEVKKKVLWALVNNF